MAVATSSRATRNILRRIASGACGAHFFASSTTTSLHRSSPHLLSRAPLRLSPPSIRQFSSISAFLSQSWRCSATPCSTTSPCGMSIVVRNSTAALEEVPSLPSIYCRTYSKRPKKWQGGLHAYVQVEPGAPCPPYSPNAGSVKKRKHNKRMAQRHAFAKAQAHQRKEETKAALIKRDAERRKRWREAAARARAWAKHLEEKQKTAVAA
ncbi:unnamed protein product [Calypogeia fissa]